MDNIQQIKLKRRILKNITKQESGCWIWRKKNRKQGYAVTQYLRNGKYRSTSPHRLSYILFRNRPDLIDNTQLFVCHKCDHKDCVNPEHLFVGDWLENAMDDVLRNPKVTKAWMLRIEALYRKKHNYSKFHKITKLLGTE